LTRGEPLLEAKLAPVGTKGGLSTLIGEGRRAITVKVNEVVGVAGFALPGNYVDVLISTQDDAGRPISKIVLEKILVLAAAQELSRDDTKPKVVNAVTLEVTPVDAERIDLARSVGTLSLVLRNAADDSNFASTGVTKEQLLGMAKVQKAVEPVVEPERRLRQPTAPTRDRVEVIRGLDRHPEASP
jgi:pilus assembly protein CpaB